MQAPSATAAAATKIFTRPAPSAVTYDLSIPDQATITVPRGSAWTSGAHWHATHTEYLEVLAGAAEVRLGDMVLAAVTAADGAVVVPRGMVHEWRRSRSSGQEENLVVREWADPKDGQKEAFFRGLNGMLLDAAAGRTPYVTGGRWDDWMLEVDLWNLFWRLDNWPVVLEGAAWPGWVQGLATRAVFAGAVGAGWVLGRKLPRI
jgi:uncharacterized RmlC-like cupin family protein